MLLLGFCDAVILFIAFIKKNTRELEVVLNFEIYYSPITNHTKLKRDFSLFSYKNLLANLINSGFCFFDPANDKISEFDKGFIIRHDVDRKPLKALQMAEIENELGVKSIYFFRNKKSVFVPDVMKKIAEMGHSIGYHYENLSSINPRIKNVKCKMYNYASQETSSDTLNEGGFSKMRKFENVIDSRLTSHVPRDSDSIKNSTLKIQNCEAEIVSRLTTHYSRILHTAINDFKENLIKFRSVSKIKFISAHGSPRSKFDNRDLWKYYDYNDFNIESDFSIAKDEMIYITDAGRSWNNLKVNRRDVSNLENFPSVRSVNDIPDVKKSSENGLVMLNIHPEHWASYNFEWMKIYVNRKLRNLLKKVFLLTVRRST
jgi:hypothetical protein